MRSDIGQRRSIQTFFHDVSRFCAHVPHSIVRATHDAERRTGTSEPDIQTAYEHSPKL
jgi:hypothetical protein